MARLGEQQSRLGEQQARSSEKHDREIAEITGALRRAVKLGIEGARAERKRRQELDEKITQLAAAQLVTEEKLQNFIASLGRSTNGGSQKP